MSVNNQRSAFFHEKLIKKKADRYELLSPLIG